MFVVFLIVTPSFGETIAGGSIGFMSGDGGLNQITQDLQVGQQVGLGGRGSGSMLYLGGELGFGYHLVFWDGGDNQDPIVSLYTHLSVNPWVRVFPSPDPTESNLGFGLGQYLQWTPGSTPGTGVIYYPSYLEVVYRSGTERHWLGLRWGLVPEDSDYDWFVGLNYAVQAHLPKSKQ